WGTDPAFNFKLAARLYECVCENRPTANKLEQQLFRAGDAWEQSANVIQRMRSGDHLGLLSDLGVARLAMRNACIESKQGFERQELLKFDGLLETLTLETLGATVERIGDLKTDAQKAEGLLAMQTALRGAVASGIHAIRDFSDPMS